MEKTHVSKSKINGIGLFATKNLKRDEHIFFVEGDIVLVKDFEKLPKKFLSSSDNWVGISKYRYINTANSPIRFINHSCEPNSALISPRNLVAIKDIPVDTEITMDYSLTEAGQDYVRPCSCNSKNCRKVIEPINRLSLPLIRKYLPHISKNFLKTYCAMNNLDQKSSKLLKT